VTDVDRSLRPPEDERARHEVRRIGTGVVLGDGSPLGPGHVARLLHEAAELGDRDGVAVDPEAVDRALPYRSLLPVEAVATHSQRAARDLDHVLHAKTDAQSFFMLTTVTPSCSALASAASAPAVYANSRPSSSC